MKRFALLPLITLITFFAACHTIDEDIPPPIVPELPVVTFSPANSGQPSSSVNSPDVSDIADNSNIPEDTEDRQTQPPDANTDTPSNLTLDDLTFLGDSTTYGLKAYEMLSGGKQTTQVWTPSSGTLALFNQSFATIVYPPTGEEIPIRDAVALAKPVMLIITLGVNGVSTMGEADFKADYSDLIEGIQAASPNTTIVLQSIFPVASHYEHLKSINNDKITAANVWVKQLAESYGLKYVNAYSKLVGADGFLPAAIQNGDGLHLNSDGFNIVLNNLKTELGINQ